MIKIDLPLGAKTLNSRILIVDDQEANVHLLEGILELEGYANILSTTDPFQAVPLVMSYGPDIILLDLTMPLLDGFQIMEMLKPLIPASSFLPILVLTADVTVTSKRRALSMGAKDFLTKPFDHMEVLLRIKNLLESRSLHLQLSNQNQILEERVFDRTAALEQSQVEMLERLAIAAEYRDDATGHHIHRVGHHAALLASALGVSPEEVKLIKRASPLHDVGKIGIPDVILLKPGKLTYEEFEVMKTHTIIGAGILSGGHSDLTKLAEQIAMTHHERWDGKGYPQGLSGEAIPIAGRIVTLADVYDALTHERPYKKAWTDEEATAEITRQSGTQFDPRIVSAFLKTKDLIAPTSEF